MNVSLPTSSTSIVRWLAAGLAALLLIWITFFDSHSLLRRYQWHQELERLTKENQRLQAEMMPQQRMLLELARNFAAIGSRKHQDALCNLARALASESPEFHEPAGE